MEQIALLSDVHGDVHALQSALAQIDRLGQIDRILCAGDLVGYGYFPEETLALLRERQVTCVKGNHDRWASRDGRLFRSTAVLEVPDRQFLDSLPRLLRLEIQGVRVGLCHGTPSTDMEPIFPHRATPSQLAGWLKEAGAEVLVVGHSHRAFSLTAPGGGQVINPGRLLTHPALEDEGPGGTFGVLELPSRRFTVLRCSDGQEVEPSGPGLHPGTQAG